MGDMLRNKAIQLGKLLDDHRGGKVVVMDMGELNFWTDYFIIATVSSSTHSKGLEKHVKEFVRENDLEILHRSRKPNEDDEWCLLDLGAIVIHLMTDKARSFYELERLWSSAPFIYEGDSSQSSKSS